MAQQHRCSNVAHHLRHVGAHEWMYGLQLRNSLPPLESRSQGNDCVAICEIGKGQCLQPRNSLPPLESPSQKN